MCLRNCLDISKNWEFEQKAKNKEAQNENKTLQNSICESMRIGSFQVRIYNEHRLIVTQTTAITASTQETDWLHILIYTTFVCNHLISLQLSHSTFLRSFGFSFSCRFFFYSFSARFRARSVYTTRLFSNKTLSVLDAVINEVSLLTSWTTTNKKKKRQSTSGLYA